MKILHNHLSNYPTYGTEREKKAYIRENFETGYTLVADLALMSNELDVAYEATQNGIDEQYPDWVNHADQYEDNKTFVDWTRSSSIGDIFIKDGKTFVVDNCGFLEVNV